VADGGVGGVPCAYLVGTELPGPPGPPGTSLGSLNLNQPPSHHLDGEEGVRHVLCIVIVKVVDNLKITENDLLELQNNENDNKNT
jgi:hypothetical protein